MLSKAIGRFWSTLARVKGKKSEAPGPVANSLRVRPFTTGVRTEVDLSIGDGSRIRAAEFLWICTVKEGQPSKALKILLLPN